MERPLTSAPLLLAVLLLEFFNASGGVNQLLLPGKERVAGRADLQAYILLRGTGLELISAGATHQHLMVLGMYFLFHTDLAKLCIIPKAAGSARYKMREAVIYEPIETDALSLNATKTRT
jgi:hypothetical protein